MCQFAIALPTPYTQQFKIIKRLNSINSDEFITAFQQLPLGENNTYFANQLTADLCKLYNSELQ